MPVPPIISMSTRHLPVLQGNLLQMSKHSSSTFKWRIILSPISRRRMRRLPRLDLLFNAMPLNLFSMGKLADPALKVPSSTSRMQVALVLLWLPMSKSWESCPTCLRKVITLSMLCRLLSRRSRVRLVHVINPSQHWMALLATLALITSSTNLRPINAWTLYHPATLKHWRH